MNEAPEVGSETATQEPGKADNVRRIAPLSFSLIIIALISGFFAWDFSEIIFAHQHRRAALELVQPGMRLMQAERELNQQRYITLYLTEPGVAPALDVGTCRRLPLTFQLLRKLFPRWRAPERAADHLLTSTHFKIIGDENGEIRADSNGEPLIEL